MMIGLSSMSFAQNSANANAAANANVACPISIIDNAVNGNLDFGTIVNSAAGGAGVVTVSDGVFYSGVSGYTGSAPHNTPHAADFTITGQSGFSYSITPTIVTNFNGTGVTLSNLTSSQGTTHSFATGGGCVSNTLDIGGAVVIQPGANGAYVAQINVAVSYN